MLLALVRAETFEPVAILSVASLAGGTAMSCLADRLPIERAHAELLGGLMLVLGLVIIGFGLSPLVAH